MIRTVTALMLALAPAVAAAQDASVQGQPPERIRSILLKPGDRCPESTETEVVVCAPVEQPYRIPREFRQGPPVGPTNSWVNRAATLDEAGRVAGGLPNTCSPVGFGGQGGCVVQMLERWRAERRAIAKGDEPN